MKKDEAKRAIDEGLAALNEALKAGKSEQFERYLAVMSRFHRYSFGNAMLILVQRPDATHVAGYQKWKELGRQVKKGASGIGILAPMRFRKVDKDTGEEGFSLGGFKVVHVFDVADTEGEDLPQFAETEGDPGDYIPRIEHAIREAGITLSYEELPGGANGCSTGGVIIVREGLSPAERFRVCCHEYAHELLHRNERRHETTTSVRETEAEAVAFVVSRTIGLESTTRSSDYIQLYRGDTNTLSESLEHIQKTAARILEELASGEPPEGPGPERATVEAPAAASLPAPVRTVNGAGGQVQAMLNFDSPETEEDEEEQPELRVGRADYQERKDERIERYETRAKKARSESNAAYQASSQMASAIPMGQPMMPGHHSYRRDVNYRARMRAKMDKSVELGDKAAYWEERAASAESNGAISSDDPEALEKLRAKIETLEAAQAEMKRLNAAYRKAGKPRSADIDGWAEMAKHLGVEATRIERLRMAMAGIEHMSDAAPCASWQLSNNSASIRRLKARLAKVEQEAQVRESSEVDHGVCRVIENVELNRIQLRFRGKPEEDVRTLLKQHGFRWARSECAWQRLLNDNGRHAARVVVDQLRNEMEGEGNECTANA